MKFHTLSALAGLILLAASSSSSQVVINEIMFDPDGSEDEYGEWVELYNPGPIDIDINGWLIGCHCCMHIIENGQSLIVPAEGYLVIGRSADTILNGNVNVDYAIGNDVPLGGADAFWIRDLEMALVDSVDWAVGGFANPRGASIELFNPEMPNEDGSSWAVARTQWAGVDYGTPGEQNSVYSAVKPNDIVISEIMSNTLAVGDIFGEWFEVYNPTDADVDLEGITFSDLANDSFTVQGSFVIPPGEFALFTVNTDSATNGGLVFERMYDWGTDDDFRFGGNDAIVVKGGILQIDSVRFDTGSGWADPEGASFVLTNLTVDNNNPQNWTVATLREPAYTGTTGDLGSPGTLGHDQSLVDITPPRLEFARSFIPKLIEIQFSEPLDKATAENPANYMLDGDAGFGVDPRLSATKPNVVLLHPGEPLEAFVIYNLTVAGIADTLGNVMVAGEATEFAYSPPALPQDIRVTEVMHDPSVAGDEGEWFEVYNRTHRDIEMSGWTISDLSGQSFTILGSVWVPARGFAVFTVNTDSATNGGLAIAEDSSLYDWGTAFDFTLTAEDAIIIRAGEVTIDSVSWGGLGWPNPDDASLAMRSFPPSWPANEAANWFVATEREPGYSGTTGDLGSPGTAGTGQFETGDIIMTVGVPPDNQFVPAEGDTFNIRAQWEHHGGVNIWFDFWMEMLTPDGLLITLWEPTRTFIPADGIINRSPRTEIPSTYPAGTYYVYSGISNDGQYPADTVRFVETTFEKLAAPNKGTTSSLIGIPEETYLSQNYPNPFNPSTEIRYGLNTDGWTTLKVYNSIGQEVITLVNEYESAGHRSVLWTGKTSSGAQAASGVYLYRLTTGSFVETRKFILTK